MSFWNTDWFLNIYVSGMPLWQSTIYPVIYLCTMVFGPSRGKEIIYDGFDVLTNIKKDISGKWYYTNTWHIYVFVHFILHYYNSVALRVMHLLQASDKLWWDCFPLHRMHTLPFAKFQGKGINIYHFLVLYVLLKNQMRADCFYSG